MPWEFVGKLPKEQAILVWGPFRVGHDRLGPVLADTAYPDLVCWQDASYDASAARGIALWPKGYRRAVSSDGKPPSWVISLLLGRGLIAGAIRLWGKVIKSPRRELYRASRADLVRLYIPSYLICHSEEYAECFVVPRDYDQAVYVPDPAPSPVDRGWRGLIRVTPSVLMHEYDMVGAVMLAADDALVYTPQELARQLSGRYRVPARIVRPEKWRDPSVIGTYEEEKLRYRGVA